MSDGVGLVRHVFGVPKQLSWQEVSLAEMTVIWGRALHTERKMTNYQELRDK